MSTENIEPTRGDVERRAALAALALGAEESTAGVEPPVVRTGRVVDNGGEVRRLLVKRASTLGHRTPTGYQRCGAVPGDVVLLTQGEADRLDGLEVTVAEDADLDAVASQLDDDALWTDEHIAGAKAGELVGYVSTNPEERARVRAIEETRKGTRKGEGPRATVMAATEPTPVEDAAAEAEQQARKDGATPSEVADANQGNDAPGSSPSGAETVTT